MINISNDYETKFQATRSLIELILNEKSRLNRIDFSIYLANIRIDDIMYLDLLKANGYFNSKHDLKFHIENLDLLDDEVNLNYYKYFFNYHDLVNLSIDNQFLFFNKFTNIQLVEVIDEIKNQNHFLWFISKLNKLKILKFN